jgi:hypothetical protein
MSGAFSNGGVSSLNALKGRSVNDHRPTNQLPHGSSASMGAASGAATAK